LPDGDDIGGDVQDVERGFFSRSLRSAGLALLTADARFFVK
jgi:hypothetical protein